MPELTSGLMMLQNSGPVQIIISGTDTEAQPLIDAVHTLLLPQKTLIRAVDSNQESFLYKKLDILKAE